MQEQPDNATSPGPAPASFEQLDALAYVEIDRYCPSCAYNLRGQPVRREPYTKVLMCRCPECGTFTPANDTSIQFDAWRRRSAKLLWGVWLLISLYLLVGALGAMTAGMVGVLEEIRQINYRWSITSPYSLEQMTELGDQLERRQREMRLFGVLAVPLIGLVAGMLWPAVFPHWKRWGYKLLACLYPIVAAFILFIIVMLGNLKIPSGEKWLVIVMLVGLMVLGLLGTLIGRPAARGMLTVLLPAGPRAIFSYLWMVDGKKPPSAKV